MSVLLVALLVAHPMISFALALLCEQYAYRCVRWRLWPVMLAQSIWPALTRAFRWWVSAGPRAAGWIRRRRFLRSLDREYGDP
jgi:hypothetical protein